MKELRIENVSAFEVLDSRGNPTLASEIRLSDKSSSVSYIPSGASKGKHEAIEMRDFDKDRYFGKGVLKAVSHINNEIASIVIGIDAHDQQLLDQTMINFDGTDNKNFLGANAMLAVSLAVLRSIPFSKDIEVYNHIQKLYGKNKKLTFIIKKYFLKI